MYIVLPYSIDVVLITSYKTIFCKYRGVAPCIRFNDRHRWRLQNNSMEYDDVIKWKHFPRYWPFVRGIHPSAVNSPHEGQWRGALMFSLICTRINGRINYRGGGDLRRHRAHYDVKVMKKWYIRWQYIHLQQSKITGWVNACVRS